MEEWSFSFFVHVLRFTIYHFIHHIRRPDIACAR